MLIKYLYSFLILLLIIKTETVAVESLCPFTHTVDLYNSPKLENGSYLYQNNTIIPPELVREYNYTVVISDRNDKSIKIQKRGCICAVKQCVRFCSDSLEQFYKKFKSHHIDYGYQKNVTLRNGAIKVKHLLHDFHPIYGQVCDIQNGYMLQTERELHNEWTLYEDSILLRQFDKRNLSLDEYCFDIAILDKDYTFLINPVVCGETIVIPWFKIWAMAFSIPFLVATIMCYNSLTLKDGRNKCFQAYLCFVTISYSMICFYTISRINLPIIPCQIFGFTIYYTIISYLTWTCILSYDVWRAITDINDDRPTFNTYLTVGSVIPLLMTFITFLAHNVKLLPDDWKPGIAADLCAVNTLRWSAVIYYYIPCIVAFIFSLTLYIMIVLFKKKHNEELLALFVHEPEPLLERFGLYFRIFLFMGISWSLDILSYFFRMAFGAEEQFIYSVLDLFNAFHGFLVFITFICRPSILKKLKNRITKRLSSS